MNLIAFIIGALFGAMLFLAGLANPDKIVGTLRLKDFHAMRVIAVFVLVGVVGMWVLTLFNINHFSVKPAFMVSVTLGGILLGIGFGLTGYCPGTGLACAAAGRLDALVSVLGMFCGALLYIFIYPSVGASLEKIWNYGKVMLPEVTPVPRVIWVLVFAVCGGVALYLTRGGTSSPKTQSR